MGVGTLILVGTDRRGVDFLCSGGFLLLVGLTCIHKCGFPGTGLYSGSNPHICEVRENPVFIKYFFSLNAEFSHSPPELTRIFLDIYIYAYTSTMVAAVTAMVKK